jgi:type IV fimbrial biogenesis protein FimT
MITIGIASILVTIALPSFRDYVRTQRVKSASFDLVAALTLTRSEAIKLNANVVMTQASGGWQNGWTITAGGQTLRRQDAYSSLSIIDSAGTSNVTFRKDGRLASTPTNFTVNADPASSSVSPRCITISLSGRPNTKLGACS